MNCVIAIFNGHLWNRLVFQLLHNGYSLMTLFQVMAQLRCLCFGFAPKRQQPGESLRDIRVPKVDETYSNWVILTG